MSVSMTLDAVRAQQKTVTRRHVDTWKNLKVGDRLTLIEKGMGLPKGAKQVVVCEVEIVDVRVETLRQVTISEVEAEGLLTRAVQEGWQLLHAFADDSEDAAVRWFRAFWAAGHEGGSIESWAKGHSAWLLTSVRCRRIEWRYLDLPTSEQVSMFMEEHLDLTVEEWQRTVLGNHFPVAP